MLPFPDQLKMILIKCCDISNEVRPIEVSEPWADCLLEEYFMQVRMKCNENTFYFRRMLIPAAMR